MAASATFALKAGVWFRRARLLIVSPDSRANLARRQAETPLIALFRFPEPALIANWARAASSSFDTRRVCDRFTLDQRRKSPLFLWRAPSYAYKILKEASPVHLPIQQPTTPELVISLITAKAPCLTI